MLDPGSIVRRFATAWAVALAIGAASLPVLAARPVPPGVDPAAVAVAAEAILCDCGCHPQSVHDCACGRADAMWNELSEEVASGGPEGGPLTGEQVIAKWVAARGEKILVSPKAVGFNLVAWLGPFALFLGAAATLVLVLRRWARNAPGKAPTPAGPAGSPPPPAIDAVYLDRIRRDVEERR